MTAEANPAWLSDTALRAVAVSGATVVEPKVISVLDYSKGFGHTDLVTV